MKTTATEQELNIALEHVNKLYNGNICFKSFATISAKRNSFTLTVIDSSGPGGRRSHSGRRVSAACWHVHGEFFDYLWSLRADCLILAGTLRMESAADNWQDRNISSVYSPMMYSEACDCNV